MKKLLAVLFALITCAAMLSAGALAEEKLELGSGSVEISTDGTYSISNVTTSYTVTVNGGVTATLTLNNVKITASSGAAITVEAGAELTLVLAGENSLTGAANFAGISVAAAFDNNGDFDPYASAQLVIQGTGSLTANGGKATRNRGAGAGIGGDGMVSTNSNECDFGIVEIKSGTVFANGGAPVPYYGAGAGIGGGGGIRLGGSNSYYHTYEGKIVISGGEITAKGGDDNFGSSSAPGIGSGAVEGTNATFSEYAIEITGGNIKATGGVGAAGIGGSTNGSSGKITIGGNAEVYAEGKADGQFGGAGIGAGDNGQSGPITIEDNAKVTAIGRGAAAGIGSGGNGGGGAESISILDNASVTAWSSFGAGIGGGYSGDYPASANCGKITLNTAGTVIAYSSSNSQAIGVGGKNFADADSENNFLHVGENTGAVWMFTSSLQGSQPMIALEENPDILLRYLPGIF